MISLGIRKLQRLSRVKILSAATLILVSTILSSQTNRLDVILAQNFTADNHIIELITPTNWSNKNILIGWQNANGQQFSEQIFINDGKNIIIPKTGWSGNILMLATNVSGLQTQIVPSSFFHSFSAFLKPNYLTPGSINFDLGYSFASFSFSWIMIIILLLTSIIFYTVKKGSVNMALLIGFISAMIALDLRQIKNHIDIYQNFENSNREITPFEGLVDFFVSCENAIDDKVWKLDKLPGVWNSYCKYMLASKTMVPKKNKDKLKANFLISNKPNTTGVVIQQARGIKLIKNAE